MTMAPIDWDGPEVAAICASVSNREAWRLLQEYLGRIKRLDLASQVWAKRRAPAVERKLQRLRADAAAWAERVSPGK